MGDAMTMHITAESRRTGHEISAGVGLAVRSLRQIFPAWVCWYGAGTRRWWGLPPARHRHSGLIEAATAEELAQRIRQASAGRLLATSRANGHYRRDQAESSIRVVEAGISVLDG
jgi:hypothetical protein